MILVPPTQSQEFVGQKPEPPIGPWSPKSSGADSVLAPQSGVAVAPDEARGARGRSTLLRAGLHGEPRRRPYGRRWFFVLVTLGVLAFIWATVALVLFPTQGSAWLLYVAHDRIWLPVLARIWVSIFPWGLLWAIPLLGLALLVACEFLGCGAAIRHSQVSAMRWLLQHGWGHLLIKVDARLAPFGLRSGFARAVARELRDEAWRDATDAFEADAPSPLQSLSKLHKMALIMLKLGSGEKADLVSGAQALALARLLGADEGSEEKALAEALAESSPLVEHSENMNSPKTELNLGHRAWVEPFKNGRTPMSLPSVMSEAMALSRRNGSPFWAALITLRTALDVTMDPRPERLCWFETWSRRGASGQEDDDLRCAEALIAFEFWAAASERAVNRASPRPDSLLCEALPGLVRLRGRGETEARDGMSVPAANHSAREAELKRASASYTHTDEPSFGIGPQSTPNVKPDRRPPDSLTLIPGVLR